MFGKIIYIDAGHGGNDNGAVSGGVLEDEINLSISKIIFEMFNDQGAYILLTRTDDYDLASLYQTNRKREDLRKRVEYINKSRPDLFLSIHLNSFPDSSVEGGQVFYQNNNEESKLVADFIQIELNRISKKNKKAKNENYYLLEKTNSTGIIIECGFLTNYDERIKLLDKKYQKEIAIAIFNGVNKYFFATPSSYFLS